MSILRAALAAHPLEACGLLLGDQPGRITAATVARNVADAPYSRFEIDPAHLIHWQRKAREEGLWLAGCWHSHPDGTIIPSRLDREGAEGLPFLWLIVAGDAMALWQLDAGGFRPMRLVREAADL